MREKRFLSFVLTFIKFAHSNTRVRGHVSTKFEVSIIWF